MGEERRRAGSDLVSQQEQVEIERPRPIGSWRLWAGEPALAAELELDPLRDGEEVRRREVALADRDSVEVRWLWNRRDRLRQIQRRDDERAESLFETRQRAF